MAAEVYRVLKPGGVFVCVSYGPPATRLGFLTPAGTDWQPLVVEIPKPRVAEALVATAGAAAGGSFFMYVMKKAGETAS